MNHVCWIEDGRCIEPGHPTKLQELKERRREQRRKKMAERTGVVTEITEPAAGKKLWSAKVGGRKVWFFGTAYQSTDPSEILLGLRAAAATGAAITVEGEEKDGHGPSGPYTSFTAKYVTASNGHSSNGHDAHGNNIRTAAPDNRQAVISRQWAINAALASIEANMTDADYEKLFERAAIFFDRVNSDEAWT